ncbi:MAG: hypothetical protein ABR562_03690 [Thermoplasmatota archaeon]
MRQRVTCLTAAACDAAAAAAREVGLDVVRHPREVRERLGVSIRGERSVYWRLTGRQNLEYFARLAGLRGEDRRRRISDVIDVVGLAGEAEMTVSGAVVSTVQV